MCSFYKEEILEKARKLMKSIANMTYNVDFNVGVQMCQVFKAKKKKRQTIILVDCINMNICTSNHFSAISLFHKENHTPPKAYDRADQPYLVNRVSEQKVCDRVSE